MANFRTNIAYYNAHHGYTTMTDRQTDRAPHVHTHRVAGVRAGRKKKRTSPAFSAEWSVHLVFREEHD